MFRRLKPFLPRSLFGRAALILIVPIVTIQLIVSVAFIQRHFAGVTDQLVNGVLIDLAFLRARVDEAPNVEAAVLAAGPLADAFGMRLELPADAFAIRDQDSLFDLTSGPVIRALRKGLPEVISIDLETERNMVIVTEQSRHGAMQVTVPRSRLSASNPHQLFVIMAVASVLMTLIAYLFLQNQVRPIKKMADAAEAFGKGQNVPYRPRGALEVRAAGAAFLDMRARIERAIETRTLMLSGISHDLRTPLTRMRLTLSMMEEDEDTRGLISDVLEMERLVDEFLAFSRGDAMEEAERVDARAIVEQIAENVQRTEGSLELELPEGEIWATLRPQAVQRAVENLVNNGRRYGTNVSLALIQTERSIRFIVEDDGPGIPEAQREAAMAPFARLDAARNQNKGSGVGLGLSIAADVARSHGGRLVLAKSESLGGLRAELHLPR